MGRGGVRLLLALALATAAPATGAQRCDAVWRDGPRGRDVPLRIDMPGGRGRVPAVIWSPGLGGSLANGEYWARAWAQAGIAVVRLSHPGSDGAVYAAGGTPQERAAQVRAALGPEQQVARVADVGFVADTLAEGRREGACDLSRIDGGRLGLAGHSMGGWVVQLMAGQRPEGGVALLTDRRFRAFIVMSGTGPADPAAAGRGFAAVDRPLLVVTGTRDGVAGNATPEQAAAALAARTGPYTGAPADGKKALLVIDGAVHGFFAGSGRSPVTAAAQDRVADITSRWWRVWLDGAADSALAAPAIGPADRWARK